MHDLSIFQNRISEMPCFTMVLVFKSALFWYLKLAVHACTESKIQKKRKNKNIVTFHHPLPLLFTNYMLHWKFKKH